MRLSEMCRITRKYGTYKLRIKPMVLGTFEWWQLEKCQNIAFCAKLPLFSDPIIFIVAPLLERINNVWDCSWQISYKMDHTWKFIISGILIHLRIKVMALWISLYVCIGSHAFAMFARKKFSGYVGFINNPYRIHVYVAALYGSTMQCTCISTLR